MQTIEQKDLRFSELTRAAFGMPMEVLDASRLSTMHNLCTDPQAFQRLHEAVVRASSMTVHEEIADIARAIGALSGWRGNSDRNVQIFCERFGAVDIGEKATLEALARRFDMTRERIRQILDKMEARAGGHTIWAPACQQAIRSQEYLRYPEGQTFAFASFCKQILGMDLQVERLKVRGKEIIQDSVSARATVAVTSTSQRLIARNGVAQMHVAYAMTSESITPATISFADFRLLLASIPDLVWLDEESGWFVFMDDLKAGKRNRLRNQIFKMLSCAKRSMDVEEIYAQLGRYRERGVDRSGDEGIETPFIAVQPSVLKAFMERLPEIEHTGFDDFKLRDDLREPVRKEYLSDLETKLYEMLINHNGIVSRAQARRELVDTARVGLPALTSTWERSPILAAVERGLCRLAGHPIDPRALEAARVSMRRD